MSEKLLTFIILFLLGLSLFEPVLAQFGTGGQSITIPNPLKTTNLAELIKRIIGWLIGAGGLIVAGVIVYAAYLFLFSGGDPLKVRTAGKTILYAVVGYAILLLSWGIVTIVQQLLGVS